jgi:hypothetical protein
MSKNRLNKKNVKLAFDVKKHDANVEDRAKSEVDIKQNLAFAECGKKWKLFKERLTSRAKGRSLENVISEMHRFMGSIQEPLKRCSPEARELTQELFEDAMTRCIATNGGQVGSIRQFVPEGAVAEVGETYQFKDKAELEAIPFVQRFMVQTGFIGFCLDGNRLIALYAAGSTGINDMPVVGSVVLPRRKTFNYPSLDDISRKVAKKIAPEKN